MFVKLCGITNREDALAAVDAGARALGFVFYAPSPRSVTAAELEPWLHEIPAHIWKVGVFVDEAPELIEEIAVQLQLDIALHSGAEIIGVNNRDLRTFRVSLDTSFNLAKLIPANVIKVSESGIFNASDIHRLMDAGFDAFLVGEHLMKSGDAVRALRELVA